VISDLVFNHFLENPRIILRTECKVGNIALWLTKNLKQFYYIFKKYCSRQGMNNFR
jgi:hypothetical protein